MTVIYRCDRCGHEQECHGVINHKHGHKDYGFRELTAKIDGARDVCGPCYDKIIDATLKAQAERRKSVDERTLEILKGT